MLFKHGVDARIKIIQRRGQLNHAKHTFLHHTQKDAYLEANTIKEIFS
jgi:hypothetical protein